MKSVHADAKPSLNVLLKITSSWGQVQSAVEIEEDAVQTI